MDQLLISLIAKAKLECEEAHRQLLFAFNGEFEAIQAFYCWVVV